MGERVAGGQGQGAQAVKPVHEEDGEENLTAGVYPSLPWGPGEREASLNAIFLSAQFQAVKASKWYQDHIRPKKRWARLFRSGALVFAGIAGLLPIVSQIILTWGPNGGFSIAPAWASVALALAAGLIGFDRFFGCSSSWLRYSATDGRVQALLRDFQLDWQLANEAREVATAHSQEDLVAPMIKRARAFERGLQALIRQETEAWRQEFQSTLMQIEETTHIAKPSMLKVETPSQSDVAVLDEVVVHRTMRHSPPHKPRTSAQPRAPATHEPPVSGASAGRPTNDDIRTKPPIH